MRLGRHVGRAPPRGVEDGVVAHAREAVPGGQSRGDRRSHRRRDGAGHLDEVDEGGTLARRSVEGDDAEADLGHAPAGEVVEPGPDEGLVLGGAGAVATVARPQLGVLGRVLHVALDDPRVHAALGDPLAHAVTPVLAGGGLPVAEQLRDPAGGEVGAHSLRQGGDDTVTGGATVAVLVERHVRGPRRDDEGGIAHDQVEGLPRDGLEEGAGPQLPVDAVEPGVELRVAQRPLGQVRRHDRLGVAGEVEGLHPGACPEVESALDGGTWRPRRQSRRGAADAEDVVDREGLGAGVLEGRGRVRGHPPAVAEVVAVRPQVDRGDDVRAVRLDDPQGDGTGDAGARQCPTEVVGRGRQPQTEAGDEHPDRVARAVDRPAGRERVLTAQRVRGEVAEALTHRVDAEVDLGEVLAELRQERGVDAGMCRGVHGHEPRRRAHPRSQAPRRPESSPRRPAWR